jgi:nucleoside-diphosphate-sugar epimerase
MLALVTGGAGFIGSHLVEALLAQGIRVRVLDDFSTGTRANLAAVADAIELLEGDIRDNALCQRACAGVDRVWHLAAMASVPQSVADPLAAHAINTTGTLQLLVAARDAGVRRFVFASTCAVYGENLQVPRVETLLPQPMSPYASSKLAAEHYIRQFGTLYGLEAVALRFFNIFGPRQDPQSPYAPVIPRFCTALLEGDVPVIFGDGEQSRDFVYVKDCVQVVLAAGLRDGDGIVGEVFNVASGRTTSINRLLALIQGALGIDRAPQYCPARPGDIRYSDGCNDKLIQRLQVLPCWELPDAIAETARWFSAQYAKSGRRAP